MKRISCIVIAAGCAAAFSPPAFAQSASSAAVAAIERVPANAAVAK
jgi:hypothetical protein